MDIKDIAMTTLANKLNSLKSELNSIKNERNYHISKLERLDQSEKQLEVGITTLKAAIDKL